MLSRNVLNFTLIYGLTNEHLAAWNVSVDDFLPFITRYAHRRGWYVIFSKFQSDKHCLGLTNKNKSKNFLMTLETNF